MAWFLFGCCLPTAAPSPRGYGEPRVVVGQLAARGVLWVPVGGGEAVKLFAHLLQLLFDATDEFHDRGRGRGRGMCRIDCVPAHATPVIGVYPRSFASGTVLGFRLAPSAPSGARVPRARLAVIARRAYGLILHGSDEGGRGRRILDRVDCVPAHATPVIDVYPRSSAPGTVLGIMSAPSSPSVCLVSGTWVLGLPEALPFCPIVAAGLNLWGGT